MSKDIIIIDGVRYHSDRPSSCRGCYFRYRRCLFSACPYGKDRNTAFRRKPLRKEKIIGKEVGGMNA